MRLESVLIVDDEPPARRQLSRLIRECADVTTIHEAATIDAAVARLATTPVDLILLDVHVPAPDGFALFRRAAVIAPVIFVTAHDAYAVRAFEVNALDYLLKPVEAARLAVALSRLSLTSSPKPVELSDLICLRDRGRQLFVRTSDILWITAADDYTELHLADRSVELCSFSMAEWEARLPPAAFTRVHRSTIVAVAQISEITRSTVRLRDRAEPLRVGRSYQAALVAASERFDPLHHRRRRD